MSFTKLEIQNVVFRGNNELGMSYIKMANVSSYRYYDSVDYIDEI